MAYARALLIILSVFLSVPCIQAQSFKTVAQTPHINGTKTAIFSPDGEFLISSGFDNLIKIRKYRTGEILREIKTAPAQVNTIAFFSDSVIITGDSKGQVALYNICNSTPALNRKIAFHQITSLIYDKNSGYYWCAGYGGLLTAVSGDSLNIFFRLKDFYADFNTIDINEEGELFLGATNGKIYVFNTFSKIVTDSIFAFDSDVSGLKALNASNNNNGGSNSNNGTDAGNSDKDNNPSGKSIIATSFNGTAKIFEKNSLGLYTEKFTVQTNPSAMIVSLSVSPSGALAAATTFDNNIVLINTQSGAILKSFSAHEYIIAGTLFKNENELLSYSFGNNLIIWDLNNTERPKNIFSGVQSNIELIASGRKWLVCTNDKNEIISFEINKNFASKRLSVAPAKITSLELDEANDRLVFGTANGLVKVLDISTGQTVIEEKLSSADILSTAIKDYILAASTDEGKLYISKFTATGKLTSNNVFKQKGNFSSLCIAPNSNLVAAGSEEGIIYFVDIDTGEKTGTLVGHSMKVNHCRFDLQEEIFLSASDDNTLRYWSTTENLNFKTMINEFGYWSGSILLGESNVVAAGESGKILNFRPSKETPIPFEEHSLSLSKPFLFGKNHIAAKDDAQQIVVWNTTTGKIDFIIILNGDEPVVLSVENRTVYTKNGGEQNFLFINEGDFNEIIKPQIKNVSDLKSGF